MRVVRDTKKSWLYVALAAVLLLASCGGGKNKKTKMADAGTSAEPDKVLFDRATDDIQHNKYDIARLTLQTLLNTYPDSEYLAKAKLAIADSYFKEGSSAALTSAVAEYEDFITFFPFLDEAAYAQMQIAMTHFRRMEKPDRDRTNARLAEEAFQRFLLKYPNHPMAVQAEQRLREVQEVLAEGDYRIARYYYIKGSKRAAVARLHEIVTRYPLYSKADEALWMLGRTFQAAERNEIAAEYYSQLVKEYPTSDHLDDAKIHLMAMGFPVPQPNPAALARLEKEREAGREKSGLLRRSLGMLRSSPDVSMAAQTGDPNLNPPGATPSATQVLKPGSGTFGVGLASASGGTSAGVETATPGTPANPGAAPTTTNPPTTAPTAPPSTAAPAAVDPSAKIDPKKEAEIKRKLDREKKKLEEEAKKKKEQEDRKKKREESTSKKKKGLGKLIPW